MIPVASGVRVWLAASHTDMRKGFDGLVLLVQETLRRNPHNSHLLVSRGRRGGLMKVPWHEGSGCASSREWLARYGRALMLAEDKLRVDDFLAEVQAVRAVPGRSARDPSGRAEVAAILSIVN
jgi:transposase